jgi:hypothetical protein
MHAFVSKQRKTTYAKITIAKTIEGQRLNFDQFFYKIIKNPRKPQSIPLEIQAEGRRKKREKY